MLKVCLELFFLWIHCGDNASLMAPALPNLSVLSSSLFSLFYYFAEIKLNWLKKFLHYLLLAGSPSYFSYVCWMSAWGTACWSTYFCRSFLSKFVWRICWCLSRLSSSVFLPMFLVISISVCLMSPSISPISNLPASVFFFQYLLSGTCWCLLGLNSRVFLPVSF